VELRGSARIARLSGAAAACYIRSWRPRVPEILVHLFRSSAPWLTALVAALLVAPTQGSAQARATLTVRVVDAQGVPISGAGVWVDDRSVLTDRDGAARLTGIRPGPHFVRLRADGYQAEALALDFEAGAKVQLEAELELLSEVIALPVITVAVERQIRHLRESGFYAREQLGLGTFREREENAPWDHVPNAAMLFHGVRGFKVAYERNGYVIRSTRGAVGMGTRECAPMIVVDGMPWFDDLSTIPASHIQAIEAYAGPATTPPQFTFNATGTSCGTIVIWLRRR
jgi:hypothetical protein